jgi:SAM-dependent methyltransferase
MASAVPPPEYFNTLAANYSRQTGDSTSAIFLSSWDDITALKPITSTSVIHDNAAGVGTATSVIVHKLSPHVPEILATDNNPGMAAAAAHAFTQYPSVTTKELDSVELPLPDDHYTHSITNFSIFLFSDPVLAMKNVRRTLQADGLAANLTWKRFGFVAVIHEAQKAVRPDLPLIPLPGVQFLGEGVAAKTMEDAGFDRAKMTVLEKEFVATGDALSGLRDFMVKELVKMATKDWSDEERQEWEGAVDAALKNEVDRFGGMRFEAWVILARK